MRRADLAGDLLRRHPRLRAFWPRLLPEPARLQFPTRLAGKRVAFRKMPGLGHREIDEWPALLPPVPPVAAGDDAGAQAAQPCVGLLRRHDGVVQPVVPQIEGPGKLPHQFLDLSFLKRDLRRVVVRRRIALRRQHLVFRVKPRAAPAIVNPRLEPAAGERFDELRHQILPHPALRVHDVVFRRLAVPETETRDVLRGKHTVGHPRRLRRIRPCIGIDRPAGIERRRTRPPLDPLDLMVGRHIVMDEHPEPEPAELLLKSLHGGRGIRSGHATHHQTQRGAKQEAFHLADDYARIPP